MKQHEHERFEEFVFRLQEQTNRCAFIGTDDALLDQIIEGCRSSELRKKLLTNDVTLNDAISFGKILEEVQKQTKKYEKPSPSMIIQQISKRSSEQVSSRKCYNCNKPGHIAKEVEKCPARYVSCYNCESTGHFKVCCRKRKQNDFDKRKGSAAKRVNLIQNDTVDTDKAIFFVNSEFELNEVLRLEVGGVPMKMLIDSGSPANIVDGKTFDLIRNKNARILNERYPQQDELKFKSFASDKNIYFSRAFEAEIRIPGEESGVWAHVLVAPQGQTILLSKSTAFALGVLKIGYHVNHISTDDLNSEVQEFPKVPNVLLKIQVDDNVRPVAQAARRFPIAMEADVEKAIQDLLDKNIIERAEGPLSWVSPLVPVRKADGRIRLCVDM
ncbi:uncharacterized protein LOC129761190 [Toxorhynchites rutilus septentrionalis]|uniref:uncharacterized protein LOC129761190 n=1 Tax=Toxorhynchites rutilus septentrionalis TaxID=329112 RepID=UPI0024796849|nr:uncharacterized protein LOC129761190 [Toxorhynchites rutilus septentrionalis]